MTDYQERILHNMAEFRRMGEEKLPDGLNREQVCARLRRRSKKCAGLMDENNALIERHILPLEENPGAIKDDEAEDLFQFAQRLFTLTERLDMGLAMTVHSILLARARQTGNVDHIVRHLYWTGIIMQQLDGRQFFPEALAMFIEAASFRDRYFEIENKETRMYINRSLGNVYLVQSGRRAWSGDYAPFQASMDEAIAFWTRPDIRERDPDFPWDMYITNAYQNACAWMDILRNAPEPDPEIQRRVCASFHALTRESNPPIVFNWPKSRYDYLHLAIGHLEGIIGYDEMMDGLWDLFSSVEPGNYSADGMYRIFHMSGVIMTYLEKESEPPSAQNLARRVAIFTRVMEYCKNMPEDADKQTAHQALSQLGKAFLGKTLSSDYFDTVLRFTTFIHLFTYVHSLMVENIMGILADYLIGHRPETLIGLCGAACTEEVAARRPEIIAMVRRAGLCHDIGKVSYYSTVSLCSRRLNDFEFNIVKKHVVWGGDLPDSHGAVRCVRDVMLGHHKWYDGTGGYPPEFDNVGSDFKIVIDMASVADSIDAATDDIGRTYAQAKTLEEVIGEIRAQAGSRYSPILAEALADEALKVQLQHAITEGREDACFAAYLDISSRD